MFPIGNPFDDLWSFVTSPFESLVGWAGDKIFEGITNWIAKGCVQLLGFVWSVMDRTASPHLDAEWFSGTVNSPYQVAARIGGLVLLGVFFVSIAHGIARACREQGAEHEQIVEREVGCGDRFA